jgi:hypothetical protein
MIGKKKLRMIRSEGLAGTLGDGRRMTSLMHIHLLYSVAYHVPRFLPGRIKTVLGSDFLWSNKPSFGPILGDSNPWVDSTVSVAIQ